LNIRLTARIWCLVTSICLVRWKNTLVADEEVETEVRKWLR
jgi:hypothetical protein